MISVSLKHLLKHQTAGHPPMNTHNFNQLLSPGPSLRFMFLFNLKSCSSVKLADLQIDQLTRVQKHAKLTHTEITTLPDNTRLYEGVGRMFILQSKEEINNQLMDKQKTADEKIRELEQKKVYLELKKVPFTQPRVTWSHLSVCLQPAAAVSLKH
uniref:Prefoldin subunit 1 n=1 Tax=Stegastes partitus TaxID=144197 RepID=A0A3B4ZBK4_9TELE